MLKLYEHPLSAYAMKVKIALNEKGIDYETAIPDGMAMGKAGGEFVDANPRAEVPTLVDGDFFVFDSTVILEYIEDKWPRPPLLPKLPAERARVRMIEDVMDTQYEQNNWGTFEVLRYQRASGELADKLRAYGKANIEQLQGWLDRQLGNRPWFNGDSFGWARLQHNGNNPLTLLDFAVMDYAGLPYSLGDPLLGNGIIAGTTTVVPEPTSFIPLAMGAGALFLAARRRRTA